MRNTGWGWYSTGRAAPCSRQHARAPERAVRGCGAIIDLVAETTFFFFFKGSGAHRDLPSSPPRRSPDLITVGGGKEDEDAPASGNLDVAGAVGLLGGAKEALDRRFEAQRLVDRRRHETRVRAERARSEEHTSELQSQSNLVCRLLLEKKK